MHQQSNDKPLNDRHNVVIDEFQQELVRRQRQAQALHPSQQQSVVSKRGLRSEPPIQVPNMQKLQAAFEVFNSNQNDQVLKQKFQQEFSNINLAIVEKGKTAISNFILNSQNQVCQNELENYLIELIKKIHHELSGEKKIGAHQFNPIIDAVLEIMIPVFDNQIAARNLIAFLTQAKIHVPHCLYVNRCISTLTDLENSSNANAVALKKHGWTYISVNSDGKQCDLDINRLTTVNHKSLRSNEVEQFAQQYPLLKSYTLIHTQKGMYFFFSAIWKNLEKAKFSGKKDCFAIVHKGDSTNITITQMSACLEADNNLLFMMNPNTGNTLYSIPGHLQTVFEKTGKYYLQAISAEKSLPSDQEIKANPEKLYLYLEGDVLKYAVYNGKMIHKVSISDMKLGEKNSVCIKELLKKTENMTEFEQQTGQEALSVFSQITSSAGYPIAGLKLKTIKSSNSILMDLMTRDYTEFDEVASKNQGKDAENEKILENLVSKAKHEESTELMYSWYKDQAKIFFSTKFFQQYDATLKFGCNKFRKEFLIEVNQFLLDQYHGDKSKFGQFLLEFYKEELVSKAKLDEGIESLCGWYKDMAKFFFSENFVSYCSGMLDCHEFRQKFIIDVSLFISQNYNKPQGKFQEFISDTGIPEFLSGEKEPKSLFREVISGFDNFFDFDNFLIGVTTIEEPLPEKIIPQKSVRSLPLPGYGLHSTIECSIQHKFILSLYLCITKKEGSKELPSPVPEVSLNEDGGLSITIPEDDRKFTSAFKAYNEELFNQHFKSSGNGKFVAIFKDENTLKEFLLACNMMESNINIVLPKLYEELRKEENKSKSDSKNVMIIETRPQPSIHPTSNFLSQQSAISAELKDKFPQKQQPSHGSHHITPSRSLPLPKNNSNVIAAQNSAFGQQSASDDSVEFKYRLSRRKDEPKKPVISPIATSSQLPHQTQNNKLTIDSVSQQDSIPTEGKDKFSQVKPEQKNPHHATPSRSLPVIQDRKQSIVPNTKVINTKPQQNLVSIEFKSQLSQNIIDTQRPKIGSGQQSYQTKPSDANLVNAVRSHSSSNLLAACTASAYPAIEIFAKVAYFLFTGQKYQYGALPQITLNAEDGCFSIAYNSHKPKEFKHPGDLKMCFSQLEGFEKVDMEKLCQELCKKQNINYEDISKKWENPKSFLSNFDFS